MKIRQYFELIEYRAIAELRRGSSDMHLGIVWWLLEPLLYMAVFYIVFGIGLKKGGSDFVFYLLCGLVPWKWFDSTVRTSSGIIYSSSGLMKQVYFPKWILPGYIVIANAYKFFIVFFLLITFFLVSGISPAKSWFYIPLLVALQFFLNLSCALFCSAFVPLMPDMKHIINYGMTMLFFMSGVFFDVSALDKSVSVWLQWIPTVVLIKSYRDVLLFGIAPELHSTIALVLSSAVLLLTGGGLVVRLDRYYPRVVS